jgi:hypothetical protein
MLESISVFLFGEPSNADVQAFRYSAIHVRFRMRTYGGSRTHFADCPNNLNSHGSPVVICLDSPTRCREKDEARTYGAIFSPREAVKVPCSILTTRTDVPLQETVFTDPTVLQLLSVQIRNTSQPTT